MRSRGLGAALACLAGLLASPPICAVAGGDASDSAVFALAQSRGRLFIGSRNGDVAVFSRWTRAQREARGGTCRAARPPARRRRFSCRPPAPHALPTSPLLALTTALSLAARAHRQGDTAQKLERAGLPAATPCAVAQVKGSWEADETLRGHAARVEALQVKQRCARSPVAEFGDVPCTDPCVSGRRSYRTAS